jgi:hypothetical protein
MHCIISWDISKENPEWEELNDTMKKCFSGYSWVKPLSTFYIVKIDDTSERDTIKEAMVKVCRKNSKKINFIISPVLEGSGVYGGWLPKTLWPKIRKRTTEVSDEY